MSKLGRMVAWLTSGGRAARKGTPRGSVGGTAARRSDAENGNPGGPDPQAFVYSDEDTQRYAAGRISEIGTPRIKGNRIWMDTRVQINAPPGDVVEALLGNWQRWWRHGVVEAAPVPTDLAATHVDGVPFMPATTFRFKPVGYLVKVLMTVSHPTRSRPDGVDTYRMPVDLRGHFIGPGEMIVTARPDGGSVLVSRWHGVRNTTLLPTRLVAKLHFKAENGTSPLQHHTGYAGLISCLERHDCLASPVIPQTPPVSGDSRNRDG